MKRLGRRNGLGGPTNEIPTTGLLPAAIQGVDNQNLLRVPEHFDEGTESKSIQSTPAGIPQLFAWNHSRNARGLKLMALLFIGVAMSCHISQVPRSDNWINEQSNRFS